MSGRAVEASLSFTYVEGLHVTAGGHLVLPGKVVPPMASRGDGTLWIGQGTVVQGGIRHAGGVVLAKGCTTWSGIDGGHEVVLGGHGHVRGGITARGRIVVQHAATVHGDLDADGDVLLLGDCVVGDVRAGGDIVVVGRPQAGALIPAGRVQTRPW